MRHRIIALSLLAAVTALLATPRVHALAADPPTIASVTPNSGSASGGTQLTIFGNGFVAGAYVAVGGVLSPTVNVLGATRITAVTPPGTAGSAPVLVINPDGQSASFSGFSYTAVTAGNNGSFWIAGISPPSGTAGQSVNVTGGPFDPNATASFGGVPAASFVAISSIYAIVTAPPGSGSVSITVTNPNGQTATSPTQFTYTGTTSGTSAPSVTSVAPTIISAGGGLTISGGGFVSGATVTVGGFVASNVNVVASTLITATAPAGPGGVVSVVVTNPGGAAATFAGVSYPDSTSTGSLSVTSVAPMTVSAGGVLTISGAGFVSGATVNIGGFAASNVSVLAPTLISVTAPAGPSGTVTVIVTNPGGAAATFAGLSYGAATTTTTLPAGQPSVASVSPSTGSSAGGTSVSISGSGFVAPATVTFGGVPATGVTVVSPNLITATAPANPVGAVAVLVAGATGAVGGLTSGFTYELAWPRVTSLSPSTGALTGGTTLTINGTGFAPGASVTIGGQSVATVSAVSPTQIVVTTPPAGPGLATILVTNPGGAISGLAGGFNYSATPAPPPAPTPAALTITGVTPTSGPSAGGTPVMISGTGFQIGAVVSISGINVPATIVSSTQMSVTTPSVTGTGSVTVTVTNLGGTPVALPNAFTYTADGATTGGATGGGTATGRPSGPVLPGGGLFVFGGGSNAQLVTASGCNPSTAVLWTTNSVGAWVGYIPSVPVAIVNAAWNELFPNGIPAATPIFARC